MIYTVTLNPALDKTARVDSFTLDAVNRVVSYRQDPGGKGINVSKVIAKLGGTSKALALLGGATGKAISQMLSEQGLDCWSINASGETRTNLKIVDPVADTHTDINEPGPEVAEKDLETVLRYLTREIEKDDIVVLSGSLPRGAKTGIYGEWAKACAEAGARVFLDADGDALREGLKGAPYLVKPNEIELGRLIGRKLESIAAIQKAARELLAQGVEKVVVSMGGAGALFVDADHTVLARSPKVPVGSTVGAGDTVVAALAYAFDEGLSEEDPLRLSMATGAANVMSEGTQAAERSTVDGLIDKVTFEEI